MLKHWKVVSQIKIQHKKKICIMQLKERCIINLITMNCGTATSKILFINEVKKKKELQVNWIKLKAHFKHISLLVQEKREEKNSKKNKYIWKYNSTKTIVSRQVLLSNCKIDT